MKRNAALAIVLLVTAAMGDAGAREINIEGPWSLRALLAMLAFQAKVSVTISPEVGGVVNVKLAHADPGDAFEALLSINHLELVDAQEAPTQGKIKQRSGTYVVRQVPTGKSGDRSVQIGERRETAREQRVRPGRPTTR